MIGVFCCGVAGQFRGHFHHPLHRRQRQELLLLFAALPRGVAAIESANHALRLVWLNSLCSNSTIPGPRAGDSTGCSRIGRSACRRPPRRPAPRRQRASAAERRTTAAARTADPAAPAGSPARRRRRSSGSSPAERSSGPASRAGFRRRRPGPIATRRETRSARRRRRRWPR